MKLIIIFLIILAIAAYIMVWVIIDMRTYPDPKVDELNQYKNEIQLVSPLLDEATVKILELKYARHRYFN